MAIIAKASGSSFVPCPEGAHAAVCVDVVDLGELEVTWGGTKKKQHKIRIVWQIAEVMADNKPYLASKRYTLSLHEKAGLRKDLESWRGKAFTEPELQGFDVEAVLSVPCLINVMHQKSQTNGETYANVTAVMRLPKGMEAPTPRNYVRVCERKPEDQPNEPPPSDFGGITDEDVPF